MSNDAPDSFSGVASSPAAGAAGPTSESDLDVVDEETDPSSFHLRFNAPLDDALAVDRRASSFLNATNAIQAQKTLTDQQAGIGLRMFSSDTSDAINDVCPWTPAPSCDRGAKYRSFDGTCNNLKEPNYGRAVTPYQRILLPEYAGKLHLPRKSVENGEELPSARIVSAVMTETSNVASAVHTVMVMQFGQFIDHDITHTPNHGQQCCNKDGSFPSKTACCY